MRIRMRLRGVPAVRAGVRVARTGSFLCPGDRLCYQPEGMAYFYLRDGDFLELPDEECELLASAGARFRPFYQRIAPSEDQAVLEIAPEPFGGFAEAWCDADLHVHGPFRDEETPPLVSEENLPVELLAEGMRFACVVDRNGPLFRFGQDQYAVQTKEYRSGAYGHFLFLGGCRPVEHEREQYLPDEPFPLPFRLFGAARRSGATIVCAHPVTRCSFGDTSSWPGGGYARGLPALLAAGLVDAVSITDVSSDQVATKALWYHLLDLGLRIPAMASGDVCLGRSAFPPAGTWRTWVEYRDESVRFEQFLAQVRKGTALLSSGPFLSVQVGSAGPGEEAEAGVQRLSIRLESPAPVEWVRVILDGRVYQEHRIKAAEWKCEEELETGSGSWVAVECGGGPDWPYPRGVWAHTNPVYLPGRVDPRALSEARQYWERFAEELEQYLSARDLEEEKQRRVLESTCRLWQR